MKGNGQHQDLHSVKYYAHLVAEGDPDKFFDKVAESPAPIVVEADVVGDNVPDEVWTFNRSDDPISLLRQLGP
jgi:hypothetical protein